MHKGAKERQRPAGGFTLLELVIALAILLVLSSAVFLTMNQHQRVYVANSNNSTMYTSVRSAAELISQEIGQAGSVCGKDGKSCASTTVKTTVGSGATTLTVNPAADGTYPFFQGEKLVIEADAGGTNSEVVQIKVASGSINTTTGVLTLNAPLLFSHSSGVKVLPQGVFYQGVMTPDQPAAGNGSTLTKLKLFGDINGDGSLVYVEYNCNFGTGGAVGTLTRSVTTVSPNATTALTPNTADTLIDNLIWKAPNGYTGNQYCFQYTTASVPASDGITYFTTTQIQLLISVQSPNPDPKTGQYAQLTKSFLQLSPRNVVAAYALAGVNATDQLQPTPPSIPVN